MTRKERSEAYLNAHGIKINSNLPDMGTDVRVKPAEEILRRAVAALLATQVAIELAEGEDGTRAALYFGMYLKRFGLEHSLTHDEARIFSCDIPAKEAAELTWRVEMCIPLFWACGFLTERRYPEAPSSYAEVVKIIDSCADFAALCERVQMRPEEEILDAADLIYRMDWACVDAMIKHETVSGNLSYDVVMEQHKGFNWMIGAADAENWDQVLPHT